MQFHLLGNPPLPLSDILHMTFKPFDVVYRTWVASFSKAASCLSERRPCIAHHGPLLNRQHQSKQLTSAKSNVMSAMAAVADVNDTLGSFLHVHLSKELPMLWWALLVFLTSARSRWNRILVTLPYGIPAAHFFIYSMTRVKIFQNGNFLRELCNFRLTVEKHKSFLKAENP